MVSSERVPVSWVVLVHHVPRDPSTARIAIWRRLRALGVARLSDGVVALPEDARTREHLEWVADQVIEAQGTALLLRVETLTAADERGLAASLASARAAEYEQIVAAAEAAMTTHGPEALRMLKRLRRELRAVQRRDYFPPPERTPAQAAVRRLADQVLGDSVQTPIGAGS
jgi:hypothetical protein